MIAISAEQLIGAAVAVPSVVSATWATRWLGRWLGAALKDSVEEAVTGIVKPHFDSLAESVEGMRAENAVDHRDVVARLDAVELRLEAVESQLSQKLGDA